ncbi:MAG: hypothetical protein P4M01_05105 [Acidobacteriota bacterium]|nr:hypothetical protein [Acidobacteriota bacterium]
MIVRIVHARHSATASSRKERGVALILALISLLILSLVAAGLISSTQSEIWSTSSYRKTAQARYVAETGAQQAINWITSNFTTNASSALLTGTNFNLATMPVVYLGSNCVSGTSNPCILRMTSVSGGGQLAGNVTDTISTFDSVSKNLESGFSTTVGATSAAVTPFNSIDGSYAVAAQLISATYNSSANGWLTKWKITSQGTVGSIQPARVQVVEVIENLLTSGGSSQQQISSLPYGAFATSATCGAITINGGSSVVSYNSGTQSGVSSPTWTYASGSIGTLGNVALTGGAYVYGSVYAPGYNLGNTSATVYYPYGISGGGSWPYNNASEACSSSKLYAVNEDNSGSAIQCTTSSSNCTNKATALPSTYVTTTGGSTSISTSSSGVVSTSTGTYASADYMVGSTQVTPTANTATCSYSVICSGSSGYYSSSLGQYVSSVTIPPSTTSSVVNYGVASFGGSTTTTLTAGSYFFDTLTVSGGANVTVGSSPVVVYILDGSGSSIPLNITGGSFSNSGGAPANLTFVYDGTQEIHIGNISSNTLFATIYAPNAKIVFDGNGSIYGAVIGKTVSITGGGHIIYDTALGSTTTNIWIPGASSTVTSPYLANFSWSVF